MNFRLSAEELATIRRAAGLCGMYPSAWGRSVLMGAAQAIEQMEREAMEYDGVD
jgi:hypothetical protein